MAGRAVSAEDLDHELLELGHVRRVGHGADVLVELLEHGEHVHGALHSHMRHLQHDSVWQQGVRS